MGLKNFANFTKKRLCWCLFLRTTANDCFFLTFCTSNLVHSASFRYKRKSKIFWANGGEGRGIASEEDADSDSDSESEPCFDSDWQSESDSGSVVLSEESPVQPSKEISFENLKDHATPEKTSLREPDSNAPLKDNQLPEITAKDKPERKSSNNTNEQKTDIPANKHSISKKRANKKDKRSIKTLRNLSQKKIHSIWFDSDIFLFAFDKCRFKTSHTVTYTARILTWAVDLILHKHDEDNFSKSLAI